MYKTLKHFLSESGSKILGLHVKKLSKNLKLKGPIDSQNNGKRLIYETDLDMQKVFDILMKNGYRKGQGYDPNPNTWNKSTDHEAMITRSDPIFFGKSGSLIMTSIEAEHGDRLRVIFQIQ